MSYILEALKKSQQERELGRVPTLDTLVLVQDDQVDQPRSPWAMASLGLAGAAVLIALYAALRGPAGLPVPTDSADPTVATVTPETPVTARQAVPTAASVPSILPDPGTQGPAARPLVPALASPDSAPLTGPPSPSSASPSPEPLVEAPPPKVLVRPPPPAPVARPRREPVQPPAPDAISEQEALDLELELELKRQLEADQGAEPPIPYAGEDVSADPSPPTPVPSDLIEQIDSFKRQIREGKQGDVPPQAGRVVIKGDPTRLRLSQEQQAGLPDYMMTVHVFDPDKSRRFVLINGLKYGEGDKTREGLIVEQILADGAVLSHRGSPFFVHR